MGKIKSFEVRGVEAPVKDIYIYITFYTETIPKICLLSKEATFGSKFFCDTPLTKSNKSTGSGSNPSICYVFLNFIPKNIPKYFFQTSTPFLSILNHTSGSNLRGSRLVCDRFEMKVGNFYTERRGCPSQHWC